MIGARATFQLFNRNGGPREALLVLMAARLALEKAV